MGNRFDAYLAGRVATNPTMGETQDGRPWARFRLAVDDRSRNPGTGEWETSQTIFHDVVVFGKLAERAVGALRSGDAVLAQGEFRFQSYTDAEGKTRTGSSFVASRLGPDILLADVVMTRGAAREQEAERTHAVAQDADQVAQPSPAAGVAENAMLHRPQALGHGAAVRGAADVPAPTL